MAQQYVPKFRFSTYNLNEHIQQALHLHKNQAMFLMRAVRDTIVKAAKDRVPVDTGALTLSITGDVVENPKSYAATCYVPINSPAASYAVWIHEGDYNLGKNSQEKQRKRPDIMVGPRYITRGIEDTREEIINNIKKALKLK